MQGANDEVFWAELRRLGYAEGRNIFVEYRSADGDFEKLPGFAKELVSLKVDIIVAVVTQASLAAKPGNRDDSDRDGQRLGSIDIRTY